MQREKNSYTSATEPGAWYMHSLLTLQAILLWMCVCVRGYSDVVYIFGEEIKDGGWWGFNERDATCVH